MIETDWVLGGPMIQLQMNYYSRHSKGVEDDSFSPLANLEGAAWHIGYSW